MWFLDSWGHFGSEYVVEKNSSIKNDRTFFRSKNEKYFSIPTNIGGNQWKNNENLKFRRKKSSKTSKFWNFDFHWFFHWFFFDFFCVENIFIFRSENFRSNIFDDFFSTHISIRISPKNQKITLRTPCAHYKHMKKSIFFYTICKILLDRYVHRPLNGWLSMRQNLSFRYIENAPKPSQKYFGKIVWAYKNIHFFLQISLL